MHFGLSADSWLADILGTPAWRVAADAGALRSLDAQAGPWFAYAKLPPARVDLLAEFGAAGFRLVDTNVVFARPRQSGPAAGPFRWARPEDESAVAELARLEFACSRFHLDSHFTSAQAAHIKAEWARNFFRGERGQAMAVAEVNGVVAGFNLLLVQQRTLTIDLIAVGEKFRRRGLARGLIAWAESQLPAIDAVQAGTQLANAGSIALYESLGFRWAQAHHVFHRHRV